MTMIKGMTVTLIQKVDSGEKDSFNHPIYKETQEQIDNVLVAPVSADDLPATTDLTSTKLVYTLGIPKGDTHDWRNQEVEFFGKRWKVSGDVIQGIEVNIPLAWNKKVTVKHCE